MNKLIENISINNKIINILPLEIKYKEYSESDIVKEILFGLLGYSDKIYNKINDDFIFKRSDENICLTHITPKTLNNILERFLITINESNSIRAITLYDSDDSPLHLYQSNVIEGFLSSIRDIQLDLENIVYDIEMKFNKIEYDDTLLDTVFGDICDPEFLKLVNDKEDEEIISITLINLYSQLTEYISAIHKLYVLVDKCITILEDHYSVRDIVYHIFTVLYEELQIIQTEYVLYDSRNNNKIKYLNYYTSLKYIFYNSFHPYLLILDQWLSIGDFVDINNEFFLEKTIKHGKSVYCIANKEFEQIPLFLMEILPSIYNVGEALHTLYIMRENKNQLTLKFYENICDSDSIITNKFTKIYNEELNQKISFSFALFFKRCYTEPILDRIECIDKQVISIFFDTYDLENHLNTLTDFYFCREEEYIYDFTNYLFELLSQKQPWQDSVSLLMHFEDNINQVLSERPGLKNKFHIEMFDIIINPKKEVRSFDDINCLEQLEIQYKVTWPFNIILTDEILEKYYTIFQYLLRIKRVRYELIKLYKSTLTWIKYIEKYNNKDYFKSLNKDIHSIQLYISECRHFIDCFFSGVLDLILDYKRYKNLINSMKNAKKLSDLIDIHNKYLNNIMSNILLSNKVTIFTKIINSLLTYVLQITDNYKIFMCNIFETLKITDLYGNDYDNIVYPKIGDYISIYENYKNKIENIYNSFVKDLKFFLTILKTRMKTAMTSYLEYILLKTDITNYYSNDKNL